MSLVKQINALLPQTQCKECGFSGCEPYAFALAQKTATINKCPPGGEATVKALGALLDIDPKEFLPDLLTRKPSLAVIQESECIGCTKCIQACPVDAIIGSAKSMHAIIDQECTGCGLCVEPCPMDCIEMIPLSEAHYDKDIAKTHYEAKKIRLLKEEQIKQQVYREKRLINKQKDDTVAKQNYIQMALARVQAKKS